MNILNVMYRETMYFIVFEIILFCFPVHQLTLIFLNKPERLVFIEKRFNMETVKKIESEVREINVDEIREVRVEVQPKKETLETNLEEIKEVKEVKEVKKSFKKINQKRIENQIISHESDDADIIWLE